MEAISVSLWTYGLSIAFAMFIAALIKGVAVLIEKAGLDRGEQDLDIGVPSSNSIKEEEALAVAIAVARAQRK